MSKIICDICGTSYPDTADQCPICGCAKDFSAEILGQEVTQEEVAAPAPVEEAAAVAAAKSARFGKKKAPVYDEDEDDYDDEDEDEDEDDDYEDDDDEDEDEDEHKSNAPLVVLLIIVILALLAVSAFIFVKYFMPNVIAPETTAPVIETTLATEDPNAETTVPTIPCESLALTSGGEIVLDGEGSNWLINVMAVPENTTDALIFTSSDETVAIVNEEGKVTAVGEGTAVITITCGQQQMTCTVTCSFVPETTAAPETEAPTEPEETEAPTEPLKDIVLKVSLTDLTFNGKNQGYKFKVNGLRNDECKWTSSDESIVTVDENGNVLSVGPGMATITCQYGDQKVEITIRCRW